MQTISLHDLGHIRHQSTEYLAKKQQHDYSLLVIKYLYSLVHCTEQDITILQRKFKIEMA